MQCPKCSANIPKDAPKVYTYNKPLRVECPNCLAWLTAQGAITGALSRMIGSPKADGSFLAVRAGSFRVNGDGTVARGPAFLKRLG